MKRMSEVFELPVSSGDRGYYADDVFQAGGNGEWCSTFCTDEQAQHAAQAINHVDALADALAACADILGEMEATEDVSDTERAYYQAVEALAAYRGDK